MVDLNCYVNSLKMAWVKRLIDEQNKVTWKIFYENELSKHGGSLNFESNLKPCRFKIFTL